MLLSVLTSVQAEDNPNARQARRIFNQAYQQVFGEQGATLRYDVNIIGIYKTYGTIWYKGKKSKFVDAKMNSWNDGVTVYTIKKKKKEVEIHSAKNNKSDKYSSKFKFEPGEAPELRAYQSAYQDRLCMDHYQHLKFQVGWYYRRDAAVSCREI